MAQKFDEGMEKGKAEGKAEGEQIGIEKEKIEIAKTMLQKSMDAQTIAEITGLLIEEIESLKTT